MPARRRLAAAGALILAVAAPAVAAASSPPPAPPPATPAPPATLPPTDHPGDVTSLPADSTPTTLESTTTESTTTAPPAAPGVLDTVALGSVTADQWALFDAALHDRLVDRGDRAAGVAVSWNGQLVHVGAVGIRAPGDPPEPVEPTDRFRIASISKLITATVVLQLVAEGRLTLDDPVGAQLAAAVGTEPSDARWLGVTLRGLLSHSAGVPKYRSEFFGGTFDSCEGAAAYALSHDLSGPVGTHVYSNMDFCLLGLLIQYLTGEPYEQAVTERLLTPLGITGMRTVATVDPNPDEVVHIDASDRTYQQALGGAGAWVATPADLVRILDSLDPSTPGWHPLPADLATLMHQPAAGVTFPEPWKRQFGLGTIIWPDGSYGHTGTVERTHGMLAHRPDGLSWCILVAGEVPSSTEDLANVFQGALDAAGITVPAPPGPPPTS